ncbi:MAG: hypothetical protein EBV77_13655 [Gemmatimonadaceae bacterium]|nr:hypothetical protein [Gemmatimonadaceae bacterium]
MRAVRLARPGQPVALHEVPVPAVGPGEVLVRVRAAGICHSDVHYRAGRSRVEPLPLTLGHEVAGDVVAVGSAVTTRTVGDRVCLHYLVICGQCEHCAAGREQFCATGLMLGHFTDGGWAEYIVVPERNAVRLPDNVSYEHGAVMMCSSSTSLHALRKARCAPGDVVLVIGAGGLGMSAIQIARTLGASQVVAADRDARKARTGRRRRSQRSGGAHRQLPRPHRARSRTHRFQRSPARRTRRTHRDGRRRCTGARRGRDQSRTVGGWRHQRCARCAGTAPRARADGHRSVAPAPTCRAGRSSA